MSLTRTDLHRRAKQREVAADAAGYDVHGISRDRKRLRGKFKSHFKFALVPKQLTDGWE